MIQVFGVLAGEYAAGSATGGSAQRVSSRLAGYTLVWMADHPPDGTRVSQDQSEAFLLDCPFYDWKSGAVLEVVSAIALFSLCGGTFDRLRRISG